MDALVKIASDEETAMEYLLSAFYGKIYRPGSFEEFSDLVRLADFYFALPVVSRSLYAVIQSNAGFVTEIRQNCFEILKCAMKLRHPPLFQESYLHAASKFTYDNRVSRKFIWRHFTSFTGFVVR